MRIEIIILAVGSLMAYNVYTDGKILKTLLSYKKYYTIGGIVVGALVLCWLFRSHPGKATAMLYTTNEYLKYMPVDGGASRILSPILDFTMKNTYRGGNGLGGTYSLDSGAPSSVGGFGGGAGEMGGSAVGGYAVGGYAVGGEATGQRRFKRSVSESKKRFVAARQNWICTKCNKMLTATYEIDHVIRLDRGGSNEVSNLEALCPSCHRSKTLMENM